MSERALEIRQRYDLLAPWSGREAPPTRAEIDALRDQLRALPPEDDEDRAALVEAEELIVRLQRLAG